MVWVPHAAAQDLDWQFAFERSEMLRDFQAGLLTSIGHELRNPLSNQIGSLQMILHDLCDSAKEERDYLEIAKDSAEQLLHLLSEFTDLVRHPLPIEPIARTQVDLLSLLRDVYRLTRLQAKDRGIRYLWPELECSSSTVLVYADALGLTQALLGLCWWGIRQLRYGTFEVGQISLEIPGNGAASVPWEHSEFLALSIRLSGQLVTEKALSQHPHGAVCTRLLQEMQGTVEVVSTQTDRITIEIRLCR